MKMLSQKYTDATIEFQTDNLLRFTRTLILLREWRLRRGIMSKRAVIHHHYQNLMNSQHLRQLMGRITYTMLYGKPNSTILTCHVLRLILLLICKQASFCCDIIFKIRLLKISALPRIQFEVSLLKSEKNRRKNSKKAKISDSQTLTRVSHFKDLLKQG